MKFFTPNFLRNVLLYKGDATKALLMQKKILIHYTAVLYFIGDRMITMNCV